MNVHAYFMRKIPNQWLYSIKTIRQMPTLNVWYTIITPVGLRQLINKR